MKDAPTRLSLQTVDDQRRELTDACERQSWQVVVEFCDDRISGAKGRDERRDFDHCTRRSCATSLISSPRGRLTGSAAAHRISSALLGEVHAAGVDLYLDRRGVDTSTPTGKALFQQKSCVPKLVDRWIRWRRTVL